MPEIFFRDMEYLLTIDNTKINNILIILPDMIGLNVLCLQALRQIIRYYEGRNISVIGFCNCSEILIDEKLPNFTIINNQTDLNELSFYIKTNSAFDVVIDFLSSRESAQIVSDTGIFYRLGWDYPSCTVYNVPVAFPVHNKSAVYDYLEFMTALGVDYFYESPQLNLSETTKEQGRMWLQENMLSCERLVVLGVGGGNNKKRWSLANYLELSNELKWHKGLNTLFVVGPMESELSDEIKIEIPDASVACNLPLQTLKGILSLTKFSITNDYAVMHISAALGIPTLAVFLSSDPVQWFPYNLPSQYIISKGPLECRPCYREDCVDWKCNDRSLFDLVMFETHKLSESTALCSARVTKI